MLSDRAAINRKGVNMSVMAVVIHTDGNAEVTHVTGDLESLTGVVGGWLEAITPMVDLGFGHWHGYIDEEGKIKGLPRNFVADEIATLIGWGGRVAGDYLVGPLVLLGDGANGEEVDVPKEVVQFVHNYFSEHGEVEMTE